MYLTYVALPKNPSVWKVWKFSDKGQYKITLALGHKYEVKTLSLSLCVFFRKNVNCKKKKMAHSSLCNSQNNIQSH